MLGGWQVPEESCTRTKGLKAITRKATNALARLPTHLPVRLDFLSS